MSGSKIASMLAPLTQLPVPWEDLARAFHVEGTYRDIVLPGADLAAWERAIAWLDQLERSGRTRVERTPDPLPPLQALQWDAERREPRLVAVLDGIRFDCLFYGQTPVEFQIDPSQVESEGHADIVLRFIRELARRGSDRPPDRREYARTPLSE